ncbi:MmcQ/YjbR family DNA-binding protein [uncultured Desulfovibrio sp.]
MLLSGVPGAFPAYHMNKRHWITLALDGSFPEAELYRLVEESFRLTR